MGLQAELAVARLIAVLGKVRGRKRLQKIVHLLKAKGFRGFQQDFVLHYYGPFSRQLAVQLDFVCAAGLVEEKGSGDSYLYTAPPEALSSPASQLLAVDSHPPWSNFAHQLNQKSTAFLEALSTVVFLHESGLRNSHLKSEFERVKPSLKRQFVGVREFAEASALI
jgi:uncharacterized protein YwgA